MGIKKIILNFVLTIINFFVGFKKIEKNKVTFVSLEENQPKDDFKLLYDKLSTNNDLTIKLVLFNYNDKNLKNNFLYFLNCCKQIIQINTSKVVLLKDNNYVVSNFKRSGVIVVQLWHASGAIKKFGNVIKREYPIKNYNYVISNSKYWQEPYSKAFSVKKENVLDLGMPRLDILYDKNKLQKESNKILIKYPNLKNKKILLYAPTFRGNIYDGFKMLDFDALKLMDSLDDEYILIYKLHPLMKNIKLIQNERIIDLSNENTHALFGICDILISDYSSIMFDFSILNKPMISYVPDLSDYSNNLGLFIDYDDLPTIKAKDTNDLINAINKCNTNGINEFNKKYLGSSDGNNTQRVTKLINKLVND
ncbi:MAG: CDP-glycerol glycerophosphotransferase family protein [Thomasclavelia sp.]|nr:CDP-glycerol glycerophosphotransferase family protein [Thomasclavelia sp.]